MKITTITLVLVLILIRINAYGAMELPTSYSNPTVDTLKHNYIGQLPLKTETIETFDLAKFKLPYLKYQSLNLIFNTYNQSQSESWKDTSSYSFNSEDFNSYLNAGGSYYRYLNTPSEQSTYNIGFSILGYPFIKFKETYDDESIDQYSYSSFQTQLVGSSRNRFYANNHFFVEVGSGIGLSYYRYFNNRIYEDENGNIIYNYKAKSNSPVVNTSLEIGGGYGRIEKVTDAQVALFILKDLKRENRLQREPSHDEIYKFAELISKKRNQRFFDNRHRIIDEVKAIDSLLTSMGLSEDTDATYFSTIYDNWLYSNNPYRASGFSISGGPKIGYKTAQYNNSWDYIEPIQNYDETKIIDGQLAVGAWLSAIDEKPLNHIWQRTLSASFDYTFTKRTSILDDEPKTKNLQDNLEIYLNASLGYYPTTRTFINLGVRTGMHSNNMDKYFYPLETNYDEDQLRFLRIYAGTFIGGYYYFSPQLRLNFNSDLNYTFYNTNNFGFINPPGFGFYYTKANHINIYFTIGFTYALF
jgi:hypothetical protein